MTGMVYLESQHLPLAPGVSATTIAVLFPISAIATLGALLPQIHFIIRCPSSFQLYASTYYISFRCTAVPHSSGLLGVIGVFSKSLSISSRLLPLVSGIPTQTATAINVAKQYKKYGPFADDRRNIGAVSATAKLVNQLATSSTAQT